jgi:hypothetical protein
MSDFNEVVKRVTMDRSFRSDLLADVDGTLAAHNYTVDGDERDELTRLDSAKLDQLDEAILEQAVGGASLATGFSFSMPNTFTGFPKLGGSMNSLSKMNVFGSVGRPGNKVGAAGTW